MTAALHDRCPADALIRALHRALYTALAPRADGSRHDRNCINRHVNAIPRACSPACRYATGAMLLAEDWEDEHDERPAQMALFEAAG